MKKFTYALSILVLLFVSASFAIASEYIVRPGDNLTKITKKVGHSLRDLIGLNEICNPDLIYPEKKILYVSREDLEKAKLWAEKRQRELAHSDENYEYFGWVLEDIRSGNIRYSINAPSGTHASSILVFSQAWENRQK